MLGGETNSGGIPEEGNGGDTGLLGGVPETVDGGVTRKGRIGVIPVNPPRWAIGTYDQLVR